MVKNDITKPRDSSGGVLGWHFPKYNVVSFEHLMEFEITKRGNTFSGGNTSNLWAQGHKGGMHNKLRVKKKAGKVSSADAVQDVGIFANAYSAKNELCRVEFQYFKIENPKGKKAWH